MKHPHKRGSVFCEAAQCMALLIAVVMLSFAWSMPVRAGNSDECGSMCNRDNKSSLEVGDPIMAANGALRFTLPLLNLGGPMGLHFAVMYGSDYVNWRKNDLGFGNAGNGRFWWSPGCAAYLSNELYQFWLDDLRQVAFNPATKEIDDRAEPQSVRYQLDMTDAHAFLMDPIRDLVYVFDKATALIRVVLDRNGNQLTYTYDGNDRLTTIIDGLGRELNFTYTDINGSFVITRVADQAGREIDLTYEAEGADNNNRGTLRSITDALDQTATFSYTPTNFITGVEYPKGNTPYTQEWEERPIYDTSYAMRVVKQTDAYGNETTLDYDNTTDQVTETTPEDNQINYTHFNHHAPPKSLTDAENNTLDITKNDRSQITGFTDRTGGTTQITYHDPTGKIASTTNARNEVLTYTYTAQNQTFADPDTPANTVTFTFYNLTRIDYPDGTSETFVYDNNQIDPNLTKGNMTARTNRADKTWNYTYNDRGQVLTAANPEGGVTTYTYNADATLATSTDSDTGVTNYTYDGYKRLIRITHPGGSFLQIAYDLNDRVASVADERGKKYDYAYDANGNLVSITDPDTKQTLFSHDLMDRMNEATDARGKKSQYAYDNMNRLQFVTDPNNNTIQYGYNSRGWLDKVTDGAGHEWTTGFDDEGLPTSTTTPLARTTTITRDALGYVSKVKNPLNQETVLTRDKMSRLTKITDPLTRETSFSYDNAGRLTGVTLPLVGSTIYRRNGLGLVDQITDLKGSVWNFTYTNMGRLASLTDPLGNNWQYGYDTRGRLNQVTYPGGATQTRTYDDAGNLLRSLYSAGPDLNYTYDNQNRLLTAQDIAFTYNEVGQVTSTTNPDTAFGATYDNGGRMQTATYNNGQFAVTYTYDARDLLTKVTDSLTNATIDFTYDDDGRLTGMTRSSGANTTVTWDDASRMKRIQHGALADLQYTYNAAGEVVKLDYDLPLDPAEYLISGTDSFVYDEASQVTTAGYTYDNQGRQIASPGQTCTWDGATRLTATSTATLTYNGLNDLLTRQSGGNTVRYYYNYALGLHPIVAEYNETTSSWKRFYVLTPAGQLLYSINPANSNAVSFYHFDKTGNTLFLTDAAGAVTDKYAYSPYGKPLAHEGASDQPFTFVGAWQVRQENSDGLYQMRARYYDAFTGRFLSREPLWPIIGAPLTLNQYQYAKFNPVSFIDITGNFYEGARKLGGFIALSVESFTDSEIKNMLVRMVEIDFQYHTEREVGDRWGEGWGKIALEDRLEILARMDPELAKKFLEAIGKQGIAAHKPAYEPAPKANECHANPAHPMQHAKPIPVQFKQIIPHLGDNEAIKKLEKFTWFYGGPTKKGMKCSNKNSRFDERQYESDYMKRERQAEELRNNSIDLMMMINRSAFGLIF